MRKLQRSQWLMGLLCALLIVARLSGAHWHLCQDQVSPMISLQGAVEPACETAATHHDIDFDSAKTFAAKVLSGAGQDLLLFALIFAAWIVLSLRRVVPSPGYLTPAFSIPAFSRHAPPRAPPL